MVQQYTSAAAVSPSPERVQLLLWLRHVAVVVGEGSQLAGPVAGVRVNGVKTLVVLHSKLQQGIQAADGDVMLPNKA